MHHFAVAGEENSPADNSLNLLHLEDGPPQSYLDHARTGGRYGLGFATIVFGWALGQALVFVAVNIALGGAWPALTASLLSFVPLLLITPLATKIWLRRGWRTLITPRARVSGCRVWRGFTSWSAILLLVSIPAMLADPDGLVWGPDSWNALLRTAAVALALIGLQTTAEELLFRGYVIQWLSLRWQRRAVLASVSGAIFTLPHLANPEILSLAGPAVLLGPVPYFVLGYTFAWVSIATGSTELVIGAHWANNLLATTLLGATNSALAGPTMITDSSPNVVVTSLAAFASCALFAWWNVRRGASDLPSASRLSSEARSRVGKHESEIARDGQRPGATRNNEAGPSHDWNRGLGSAGPHDPRTGDHRDYPEVRRRNFGLSSDRPDRNGEMVVRDQGAD